MTSYDWFMIVIIIITFSFCISWLCFARISVSYIEKEMKKKGNYPPSWDSLGIRVPQYAMIINFPLRFVKGMKTLGIAADNIKKSARKCDWYLAFWFNISGYTFIAISTIWYILYAK